MAPLRSIDLRLAERLEDPEFRREWFRAELEASVPEMFRSLREERHLTQKDLADRTGMKQSAISRFEKSRDAKWKLETLLTMADALDVQLLITAVKAEDVLASYRAEEDRTLRRPPSVLEAKREFTQNEEGQMMRRMRATHTQLSDKPQTLGSAVVPVQTQGGSRLAGGG